VEIPHQRLSREALQAVIEEFVLREGTDYGPREWTLAEKIEQVMNLLQTGKASVVYDAELDSCSILLK